MQPYQLLFDRVLSHTDPEKAHHAAFRAIRAAQPVTRLIGGRRTKVGRSGTTEADGPRLPGTAGPGRRVRQERRRHRRARQPRVRVRRDRHRHRRAPARATRSLGWPGCRPTGRWSTGWASTTTAPRPSLAGWPHGDSTAPVAGPACRWASTSARPRWSPRSTPSATTRRAPPCSRRTPTTSSSTSPRRTPRDCATSRRSTGSSPLLRAVRSRADDVSDRHVPLLVKIAPDLSDEDVLAVADLATSLGLDGIVATNTTISRDGLASAPGQGRGRRCGRALRAVRCVRAPPR